MPAVIRTMVGIAQYFAAQRDNVRTGTHDSAAICVQLTRSNVSNHLACLRDCGIVVAVPEGRQTRYEIADPHLARSLSSLVEVTLAVNENAPCLEPDCSVPGCHATEVQA